MFGPDWLVTPITDFGASSWTVYLPRLDTDYVWVYYFNGTVMGHGGRSVTVSTPIGEFPLFVRVHETPPAKAAAIALWSAERLDQVRHSIHCFRASSPT